jgi:pyruvate dehydrogenase E2 component (dihydrolipoamide acetyltransferase)
MLQEVRMPALGQTTDELRITGWLKSEGDIVKQGDSLFEVETDKATLEVESFAAGVLLKIVHGVDDVVEVGSLVAYLGARDDVIPTAPTTVAPPPSEVQPTSTNAVAATSPARSQAGKVLASPVVRALAQTHGIDLSLVYGSGPGGRIERQDVQRLIDQPPVTTPAQGQDMPIPHHRQVIARRLTQSIQTIPQIALTTTIDMRQAGIAVAEGRASGIARLTYTHLIIRAVARALRSHPRMNTLWLADGPQFRQLSQANVGLAVAGEDTLLVVTIPTPDELALADLVTVTDDAIERARKGNLIAADTAPGAISVSNLGMHRVESFTAIVDPTQTAILAVGRTTEQPYAQAGEVRVAPQVKVTLTVDHRVADGVVAARFLDTLSEVLENPQEHKE